MPLPCRVAPHVGAWIEMSICSSVLMAILVAPHVGAWIEIKSAAELSASRVSRSSCRSVD